MLISIDTFDQKLSWMMLTRHSFDSPGYWLSVVSDVMLHVIKLVNDGRLPVVYRIPPLNWKSLILNHFH